MHRTVSPDPLQQSCDLAGYGCEDPLLMSKGVAANRTGVADMPGQNEPWASLRAWSSARGNGARTVSGVTITGECLHPAQTLASPTQKSRSVVRSFGRVT